MSQHKPLPLFPETTDDVYRETLRARKTKDDREFEDAKRRKSKRKQWRPPQLTDGPHCQSCANWLMPVDKERYGGCRMLRVVEERIPHRNMEKGHILHVKDANAMRLPVGMLRTAAWGVCSLWTQVAESAA